MWLLSWLLSTVVNVVTLPLAIGWDVIDAVTDNNTFDRSKTLNKLEDIWDSVKDTFDWELV